MEFRKHAFILEVIQGLKAVANWTGKTHVQKTLFLVNEATPVQVPFDFVLYKHGPYSFDVETELEQMKSYDAIAIQPISSYGVILNPSGNADVVDLLGSITQAEKDSIQEICRFVGSKGVVDLERLATVVWVRNRDKISDSQEVANRVHTLKPHVSLADAEAADQLVTSTLTLMPKPQPEPVALM